MRGRLKRDDAVFDQLDALGWPLTQVHSQPLSRTAWSARQSCGWLRFATCASKARKSRVFAHSTLSPGSRSPNLGGEIAKSLRLCPRKFPCCRDFPRRTVRSRLPPEKGGTRAQGSTREAAAGRLSARTGRGDTRCVTHRKKFGVTLRYLRHFILKLVFD